MTSIRCAAVVLALGAAVLSACAKTDLGQACNMKKPCNTGTCDIAPSAVENGAIDYVALGSAECDDLVCIRTAGSANPENTAAVARGYCTTPCIDDTNCSPNYQGESKKLVCQRMLLDQAFLDQLKEQDPDAYNKVFGSGASSTYCVLPR
jgi:hypothetical protein